MIEWDRNPFCKSKLYRSLFLLLQHEAIMLVL